MSDAPQEGKLTIQSNILSDAQNGDQNALALMFQQFIGDDEQVEEAYYLGKEGIWGFGRKSFGCVTTRKLASIKIGWFGEVIYQDGYIQEIESGAIFQPGLLWLYLFSAVFIVVTFGLGILLMPLVTKLYYRFNKSGLIATVDVGIPIYLFANRSKLLLINRLWRRVNSMKVRML